MPILVETPSHAGVSKPLPVTPVLAIDSRPKHQTLALEASRSRRTSIVRGAQRIARVENADRLCKSVHR